MFKFLLGVWLRISEARREAGKGGRTSKESQNDAGYRRRSLRAKKMLSGVEEVGCREWRRQENRLELYVWRGINVCHMLTYDYR